MNKLEIEIDDLEYASGLIELSESNDNVDMITEKNFNGDLTTIELYVSLTINVVTLIVPIIKSLIKQKRISSLKIDGQKLEISNISQELIEKILKEKMKINENNRVEGEPNPNDNQG